MDNIGRIIEGTLEAAGDIVEAGGKIIGGALTGIANGIDKLAMDGLIRMPEDEYYFLNKNYLEVINELKIYDFHDIKTIVKKKGLGQILSKNGSVIKISIDGKNSFYKGTLFSVDSKIIITHYESKEDAGKTVQNQQAEEIPVDSILKDFKCEKPGENSSAMIENLNAAFELGEFFTINGNKDLSNIIKFNNEGCVYSIRVINNTNSLSPWPYEIQQSVLC